MPLAAPTDPLAYRRLRWQSRGLTVALGLVFVLLVAEVAARASSEDPTTQKSAALVFVWLGLYAIVASMALWHTWRRSFRARPVLLAHDAGPGATIGVPELDEPPRLHSTLSGETEPPPRW